MLIRREDPETAMPNDDDIRPLLRQLSPEAYLDFVLGLIHDLTILIRGEGYEDLPDSEGLERLRTANEAIHQLSGSLRAFLSHGQELDEGDLEKPAAVLRLFSPSWRQQIVARLKDDL